jgi:hypothetical protein
VNDHEAKAVIKAKFEIGQMVYLDGRDAEASPPLTVRRINLWDGVPRRRVLRGLRHGTRVKVIDRQFYEKEGRWYYRVRHKMKAGWLPGAFLCAERPDVLGDLV